MEHPDEAPDVTPSLTPVSPAGLPAEATQQAPRPVRRGRRVMRTLLILVLVAATIGSSGVAWQQREVAAGWQSRSEMLEQQRDDAIGRSEALSEQLGALANLVQLSVDDLATLEGRLAELAGEKAQAEDRAALTRDELRTLATQVETAVRQLNACADDLLALQSDTIEAFNRLARGSSVDVAPLNERLAEVNARCNTARRAGAAAVAVASRLR
jgi:chromosome segregation ATPase